jgi:hypothetical protein
MRRPGLTEHTRAVESREERTRVVLELAKGEPVEGSLVAGDDPARDFSGWMELVATLQSVLEERTSHRTATPTSPRKGDHRDLD